MQQAIESDLKHMLPISNFNYSTHGTKAPNKGKNFIKEPNKKNGNGEANTTKIISGYSALKSPRTSSTTFKTGIE